MDQSMLSGIFAAENLQGAGNDLWRMEEKGYLEQDTSKAFGPFAEKILATTFARLDKFAFALASGTVLGFWMYLATIFLVIKGGDVTGPHLLLLVQVFAGYTVTIKGAFLALGYGFIWGFLLGWLFAYLRNLIVAFAIYRARKNAELGILADFFENI